MEKIIAAIYDMGLVKTPADLYTLSAGDIAAAMRLDDGSEGLKARANRDPVMPGKLYKAIQDTRSAGLPQFLESLSVPSLGRVNSRLLAEYFGTIGAVLDAGQDDIRTALKNRTKTADNIYAGLQRRKPLAAELLRYITVNESRQQTRPKPQASGAGGPFEGMSFLFTGTLESMKREDAQALVISHGGSITSGVSKKLSVLVATSEAGSKYRKAVALNEAGASIQIWSEREFLDRLGRS